MSQHLFNTQHDGKPVVVLMGWDRPLQGFFLVVEKIEPSEQFTAPDEDEDEDDDSYIYSNLMDPELIPWMGLPPMLEPFIAKLQELGIDIPSRMLAEVQSDADENIGNRHVVYNANGAIL